MKDDLWKAPISVPVVVAVVVFLFIIVFVVFPGVGPEKGVAVKVADLSNLRQSAIANAM